MDTQQHTRGGRRTGAGRPRGSKNRAPLPERVRLSFDLLAEDGTRLKAAAAQQGITPRAWIKKTVLAALDGE